VLSADGSKLFHLSRGRHAPTCGSVGHGGIRTSQEHASRVAEVGNSKNDPVDGVQGVETKVA
jgi:hypothetical protein